MLHKAVEFLRSDPDQPGRPDATPADSACQHGSGRPYRKECVSDLQPRQRPASMPQPLEDLPRHRLFMVDSGTRRCLEGIKLADHVPSPQQNDRRFPPVHQFLQPPTILPVEDLEAMMRCLQTFPAGSRHTMDKGIPDEDLVRTAYLRMRIQQIQQPGRSSPRQPQNHKNMPRHPPLSLHCLPWHHDYSAQLPPIHVTDASSFLGKASHPLPAREPSDISSSIGNVMKEQSIQLPISPVNNPPEPPTTGRSTRGHSCAAFLNGFS